MSEPTTQGNGDAGQTLAPVSLLACPFCGESAEMQDVPVPMGMDDAWFVECKSERHECPMGRKYLLRTKEEAERAWNMRADSAAIEKDRELIRLRTQANMSQPENMRDARIDWHLKHSGIKSELAVRLALAVSERGDNSASFQWEADNARHLEAILTQCGVTEPANSILDRPPTDPEERK